MTSAGQSETSLSAVPEKLALDEWVLSAGTMRRFVLLLVLFVAVSASAAYEVIDRLAGAWGSRLLTVLLPYFASLVLVIAASRLYRKLPEWKVRRAGLIPVTEIADGGRVRAELDRLLELAQLEVAPQWFYKPGAPSASAVVFGTHRHPKICLNHGLVACATEAPATFQAVVLHELAHIRNGDVGITYATESLWRVLVATVLLPEAALTVIGGVVGGGLASPASPSVYELVQDVLIVGLVYLTRADILRTREIYADRTAVHLWHVRPVDLLPGRREPSIGEGRFIRARAAAMEVWYTHPSWRVRGRALASAETLVAQRAFTLLVTGLAADIAAMQLTSPFSSAGQWPASARDAALWEFGAPWAWLGMGQYLLVGGLTAGIGGSVLWRAVLHAVLTGRPVPSGWWTGLWLGAGLAVGELSNASVMVGQPLPAHPEVLVLLVTVVALLMYWTAQYAELRIRTYRGKSIADGMIMMPLVPGLVLAFVLLWWVQEAWISGWRFSVAEALNSAGLPADDASLAVRMMTILTALPGSDMGFSGLWWSVSLLWLVPLQLWLTRLPPPTAAKSRLGRIRRAAARRRARRRQRHENAASPLADETPPGPVAKLLARLLEATLPLLIEAAVPLLLVVFVMFVVLPLLTASVPGYIVLGLLLGLLLGPVIRLLRRVLDQHGSDSYWLDQVQPGSVVPDADVLKLGRFVRLGVIGGLLSWAGLLAEPLVTGAVREEDNWQIDSIENLAWIILVIVTMMLLVGVVAGWASQDRYPILTALSASGLSGLIGLLGQSVKSILDGCLGPLNSLAETCTWHPSRYAPLVEYALGYVMTLGLLAVALGAALSHTLAAALRQRMRPAGPPPSTTDRRRLSSRRPAVKLLNTIAVSLVVGTTAYQTLVMSAPLPRNALLFQYQISPTGPFRSEISPLADWMRHVGDTYIQSSKADRMIAAALDTVPAAPQQDDITSVTKKLEPACAELADIARNAKRWGREISPSLPPDLEQAWDHYLSEIQTATNLCLLANKAKTEAELLNALKEFQTASRRQLKAAEELNALIR